MDKYSSFFSILFLFLFFAHPPRCNGRTSFRWNRGELKYVSVEQRAESGEQSLENGEHKFLVQILTENVCITVGLGGITIFF